MNKDNQRRGSATAQSTNSPLRSSFYYSDVASPTRLVSPRTRPSRGSDGSSSSRSRVSSKRGVNVPPINTEISRLARNQSVMNGQPATPPPREYRNSDSGTSSLVNPTSTLLQDLIKEQRASRGSRRTMSEYAINGVASTPSSSSHSQEDTQSEKQRRINEALSAGLKHPREMGMREMDQYVSKLNKLNFDLKLEIFHRVQQNAALEKKLERMRELEEELERMRELEDELEELRDVEEHNQRLRESNEQLRLELDKRDQAITEAVELICQLEAKIEELQAGRNDSQPSTARPNPRDGPVENELVAAEISTPKAPIFLQIPERTSSKRATSSLGSRSSAAGSHRPRRTPSFLREENKNTAALRSLYVADEDKSHGTSSILTKTESLQSTNETTEPESPRLSILSECSYFDPYDGPILSDRLDQSEAAAQATASTPKVSNPYRSDMEESKIARIDRWIQPREDVFDATAPKSRDRAVSDVSNRAHLRRLGSAFQPKSAHKQYHLDSPRLDAPIFGSGRLPPTPDTMSTSNPGTSRGSNGSIVAEKTRYDQGSPYMRRKLRRPRSADEITTRPSTAVSGISGTMGTAASDATQSTSGDELPSMFPSYRYLGRGSSKATRLLGPGTPSNPGLSCYGGDIMFNGEGVGEVLASKKKRSTTLSTSSMSEAASMQLSRPSSPPLTPEDWLEAAQCGPRSRKERVGRKVRNKTQLTEPTLDSEILPPDSERIPSRTSLSRNSKRSRSDESQVSRNPTLRLLTWGSNPQRSPESQPRRRLSLRPPFFSRSSRNSQRQPQVPAPDPVDKDGAPSPVVRKTRRPSNEKRQRENSVTEGMDSARSAVLPSTPKCFDDSKQYIDNGIISRQRSESNPLSRGTDSRPVTAQSVEHKRRSSLSLLGWMKGASGIGSQKDSGRSSPATPASPISIFRREKEKRFSAPSASRPSSSLATAASATNEDTTSPKPSLTGDEESERRSRLLERRSRRMA